MSQDSQPTSVPICDNMSVGVIARNELSEILLIRRARYPFGFAPPSGHLDGLSYPVAGIKELEEETGLKVESSVPPRPIVVKQPLKRLRCRWPKGDHHFWQIFEIRWKGEIDYNPQEVTSLGWYSPVAIKELMAKTDRYLSRLRHAQQAEEKEWVEATTNSIEREWEADPGLEPVWLEFFREVEELRQMINAG